MSEKRIIRPDEEWTVDPAATLSALGAPATTRGVYTAEQILEAIRVHEDKTGERDIVTEKLGQGQKPADGVE